MPADCLRGSLTGPTEPTAPGSETVATLFETHGARIDRIVSNQHASPPDFWYDQDEEEWVVLIEGSAAIAFDDGSTHTLAAGDWIAIPPHARHRITRTDAHTVWLAMYLKCEQRTTVQPSTSGESGIGV